MNNPCPNCGIAGNNFSCPNHVSYWGINPLPDSVPFPQHGGITLTPPVNAELFAEIGRLNVLLNERNKELKEALDTNEWHAEMIEGFVNILAGLREKGVIDGINRPLPLEGHHKDCGHGKDGWSMCTCDELKKVDEERANKQLQLLVKVGQNLIDKQTAGMRGPPQCSKCGDTGLVSYGPNIRGMKHCDCKQPGVRQPDSLKELNELKEKDSEIARLGRENHLLCNLRDNLFEERRELKECLRWYVENDDTNEGGKWEESNAHWLEGKRRAMRALGMEEE